MEPVLFMSEINFCLVIEIHLTYVNPVRVNPAGFCFIPAAVLLFPIIETCFDNNFVGCLY